MARIGVIRTDVGAVFLTDIETVSQWAASLEPRGQERRVYRPNPEVATNTFYSIVDILLADALNLTAAEAAAAAPLLILRALPTTGTINVSQANIEFDYSGIDAAAGDLSGGIEATTYQNLVDELAPNFVETGVFLTSFNSGVISKYADATFSVEGVAGAAIEVVSSDDGVTPFA
jgi:hypothetical protein